MPYPSTNPTCKHDVVLPQVAGGGGGTDLQPKFDSATALFRALGAALAPNQMKKLCSAYSYQDAPKPPLSRALSVIGVADVSMSAVRELIGDQDEEEDDNNYKSKLPACLHRCVVAVKRGDGQFGTNLPPPDRQNSEAFARLMKQLNREKLVALLAQDKHHRFALLKPSPETKIMSADNGNGNSSVGDEEYQSYDFYGVCYVGKVEDVKSYLARGTAATTTERSRQPPGTAAAASSPVWQPSSPPGPPPPDDGAPVWQPSSPPGPPPTAGDKDSGEPAWQPSSPTGPPPPDDGEPVWRPPGDNDNDDQKEPAGEVGGAGGGLWQPPGTGGDNDDDDGEGGLWQPPGTGGGDNSNGGGGLWQPPTDTAGGDDGDNDVFGSGSGGQAWDGSTDAATTSKKRKHEGIDEFHTDSTAAAADAFYSGLTRSLDTRADSKVREHER